MGAVLAACGAGVSEQATPEDGPVTSQPQDLCSESPVPNADGTMTFVGCAFLQQVNNIQHHGTETGSGPAELRDAGGVMRAHVSRTCGPWLLGVDDQDQQVIINRDSGEVRSHGTLHAGEALSSLPSTLTVPLRLDTRP